MRLMREPLRAIGFVAAAVATGTARRPVLGSAVLALTVSCAACAHSDDFDSGVLTKDAVRLRVGPVPAEWRRIRIDDADLAFRDEAREASVLLDVRCERRDDDAPLSALTDHLIMGTTEREFESQEVVPFDRREAMRTVLRAKLDGVPMKYDIYVTKKNGCVYDVVYVAAPGRFAEGDADFQRFATGLVTLPEPRGEATGSAAAARDR
jgi:hypothetical protein